MFCGSFIFLIGCYKHVCLKIQTEQEDDSFSEFDDENVPSEHPSEHPSEQHTVRHTAQNTVAIIVNSKPSSLEKNSDDDDEGLPHYNEVANPSFNK